MRLQGLPSGSHNSICLKQDTFFRHEAKKGPLGIKVVQEGVLFGNLSFPQYTLIFATQESF